MKVGHLLHSVQTLRDSPVYRKPEHGMQNISVAPIHPHRFSSPLLMCQMQHRKERGFLPSISQRIQSASQDSICYREFGNGCILPKSQRVLVLCIRLCAKPKCHRAASDLGCCQGTLIILPGSACRGSKRWCLLRIGKNFKWGKFKHQFFDGG